jgi:ribonucleoside-diphosphate reductase alpha chain
MKEAAQIVKEENERVAKVIGINKAARCTTVKPSGTTSTYIPPSILWKGTEEEKIKK